MNHVQNLHSCVMQALHLSDVQNAHSGRLNENNALTATGRKCIKASM